MIFFAGFWLELFSAKRPLQQKTSNQFQTWISSFLVLSTVLETHFKDLLRWAVVVVQLFLTLVPRYS